MGGGFKRERTLQGNAERRTDGDTEEWRQQNNAKILIFTAIGKIMHCFLCHFARDAISDRRSPTKMTDPPCEYRQCATKHKNARRHKGSPLEKEEKVRTRWFLTYRDEGQMFICIFTRPQTHIPGRWSKGRTERWPATDYWNLRGSFLPIVRLQEFSVDGKDVSTFTLCIHACKPACM